MLCNTIRKSSYDRIGNILTGPQGTYTYGETNYTNPHGATAIGGTSLTYDDNGNVTAYGSNTHSWNYRDRLTKSIVGGVNTFYGYDFNNDRVTKGNGTTTTTYANKYYTVASATTTKYIFDNSGILLATVEGNGSATSTEFSHADHLNSTTITTDEDGDIVSVKDYLPYGSERVSTGDPVARTYICEFGDSETSLSYLNARYYSGDEGKFLSQDPVFWENPASQNLENPQSLNSYSYALNNPINESDPSGEDPLDTISNFVGAAADTIASFVNAAFHPISTVTNIANAISNPAQTINNVVSSAKAYVDTFKAANQDQRDAMIGQLGGSFGLPLIGMTGKVGKLGNIADNALVVRGGNIANQSATKINAAGGASGFSVQCSGTCTSISQLGELGKNLRNNYVGVTTAGAIRQAGGSVIKTHGFGSHATVFGLTGEQASTLF